MNVFTTVIMLLLGLLGVWWECTSFLTPRWLTQGIEILPALAVYAGLREGPMGACLISVLGGIFYDSLSQNPLGTTILPLFAVAILIDRLREFILHDELTTHILLGLIATGVVQVLSLLVLLSMGTVPIIGWTTIWRLGLSMLAGAAVTPVLIRFIGQMEHLFCYPRTTQTSFRTDRVLIRGRH